MIREPYSKHTKAHHYSDRMRSLIDRLRAWPWLAAALLATFAVGVIAPHQLGVLVWSLAKLALGAYLGYWIDRSVFPYARPHELRVPYRCHAMLRRAIIIASAVIALGLGV